MSERQEWPIHPALAEELEAAHAAQVAAEAELQRCVERARRVADAPAVALEVVRTPTGLSFRRHAGADE